MSADRASYAAAPLANSVSPSVSPSLTATSTAYRMDPRGGALVKDMSVCQLAPASFADHRHVEIGDQRIELRPRFHGPHVGEEAEVLAQIARRMSANRIVLRISETVQL
jgi:hypothetical protein